MSTTPKRRESNFASLIAARTRDIEVDIVTRYLKKIGGSITADEMSNKLKISHERVENYSVPLKCCRWDGNLVYMKIPSFDQLEVCYECYDPPLIMDPTEEKKSVRS